MDMGMGMYDICKTENIIIDDNVLDRKVLPSTVLSVIIPFVNGNAADRGVLGAYSAGAGAG